MDKLDLLKLSGCKILEDLNGEVHEILVSISAPLEKGMEYWIIVLDEFEKMTPDSHIDEYVYSFIPLETSTSVGNGVKIKIEEQIIFAPKGSPFIESPEQRRFVDGLMRDEFLKREKEKSSVKENQIQVGRPETFPKEKTLKWYNELKKKEEFQHKNKKPFKGKIKERIIELHTYYDKETEQIIKPSIDTIHIHFRKLGLTKS